MQRVCVDRGGWRRKIGGQRSSRMSQRLKRVLVVYSTVSGCTATIARRIGVDLIAYGARPTVLSVEEVQRVPDDYDAIVFGSGVRMGKWHREARDWIQKNLDVLSRLPVALFSVGLRGVSADRPDRRGAGEERPGARHLLGRLRAHRRVGRPAWLEAQPGEFSAMEKIALRVYPLEDGELLATGTWSTAGLPRSARSSWSTRTVRNPSCERRPQEPRCGGRARR